MDVLYAEAIKQFNNLLQDARRTDIGEPTLMTLATADESGRPSVRTMQLKEVDERGFVFLTNTASRKGVQLTRNPWAALCFYWESLKQQVTVEGVVNLLEAEESDGYWKTRSRENQLAAWASHQSDHLDARQTLERRLGEYREKYSFQQIPRPAQWSGYRLEPVRIEFWKSSWQRLHERVCYQKSDSGWSLTLLNP